MCCSLSCQNQNSKAKHQKKQSNFSIVFIIFLLAANKKNMILFQQDTLVWLPLVLSVGTATANNFFTFSFLILEPGGITKHLWLNPWQTLSFVVSPWPLMFPSALPWGTSRVLGNKTHCFSWGQSLSAYCSILANSCLLFSVTTGFIDVNEGCFLICQVTK